jgi:hypothetical protein
MRPFRGQGRRRTSDAACDLDLPAKVDGLAQAVAALTATVPEPRRAAPCWLDLAPDVCAARLAELDGWVREVLAVNCPGSVQPCWAAHPSAVWELSTLREEWLRAYDRTYPDLAERAKDLRALDRPGWPPTLAAREQGAKLSRRPCRAGTTPGGGPVPGNTRPASRCAVISGAVGCRSARPSILHCPGDHPAFAPHRCCLPG